MVLAVTFFGSDSKSQGNKRKNKQVELHQTKKFLHSKENHQQNKSQLTEWEKILANHNSGKGLIQIYKELMLWPVWLS